MLEALSTFRVRDEWRMTVPVSAALPIIGLARHHHPYVDER